MNVDRIEISITLYRGFSDDYIDEVTNSIKDFIKNNPSINNFGESTAKPFMSPTDIGNQYHYSVKINKL